MAGVKTGIDLAMDATPKIFNEIHDAQTKRHLTKWNLIFLKAKTGKLTENDTAHARDSCVRIQTVALLSQNETLLGHLEKGLLCLEECLAVKKAQKLEDAVKKQENNDTNVLGPLGDEAEQSLGFRRFPQMARWRWEN